MSRLGVLGVCLAAGICAGARCQAPDALSGQIAQIVAEPAVARDHWGIYVTALDGTPIYALNEAQLSQPASNAKLFTTAAALALLGPNSRVETRITGALDPATGVVQGDLTLLGSGDANLDSEDLPYVSPAARQKPAATQTVVHQPNPMRDINDLVEKLVAKGVRAVHGDIVGDDTYFPWEPYAPEWSIDDAVWGYAAPVSALTIADNQLRLTIAPGDSIGPATVTLEQAVPYYTIQNEARTALRAEATGVQVVRMPGSRTLRIFGSIAFKSEADVERVAIEDPAEYAAMVLRAALMEHGITVTGTARARHRQESDATGFLTTIHENAPQDQAILTHGGIGGSCPEAAYPPPLAVHESQPLGSDVTFTNKISENLHAELMLRRISRAPFCSKGSGAIGARLTRAFLMQAGLDPDDFVLFDGSGLSGHDLVTPRVTTRLLAYAVTQPWFALWKSSLPVAGEDGSLSGRFSKPPLKGHVFAKTGTLSEARALSGYLEAASGRTVIFSILVGNHMPGTSADRDAMDRIVGAIQATQ